MIISALISGLKSIVFIALLLFIVFIIYATAGTIYFGANDPVPPQAHVPILIALAHALHITHRLSLSQWHFGTVNMSFVTLFSLLTMNDWSGIFYVNYFGCDVYNGGYYNPEDLDPMWRCDNPGARPALALLYCVSFVMIAGKLDVCVQL